jgi:hypothetical protein
MRFESISDIYSANRRSRERFLNILDDVIDDEAHTIPSGESWSIAHIAEHVAIVNNGMAGICRKLIEKAKTDEAAAGDSLAISDRFYEYVGMMATRKAEAPERVVPTGGVSIAESRERLNAADKIFATFQADFEDLDLTEPKFPHPYFGDLTAVEWFALSGLHERRHTEQAERVLAKLRQ